MKIIFSHGFGVKKDSRGMFTDIAEALSDYSCDLFDYNEVLAGGDVRVRPLSEQVEILNGHIAASVEEKIMLICHSQGCVVAGLADTARIGKVILLAPPTEISVKRFMRKFGSREGVRQEASGALLIPRSDGTTTYISQSYLAELDAVEEPLECYQRLAVKHDVTIIRATADNILGMTSFGSLSGVRLIDIDADHDFTGNARRELIERIKEVVR